MHFLPDNVLFNIIKYIDNCSSFLKYLEHTNKEKYIEIIKSLNNKVNNEYQILKILEDTYKNIKKINNKLEYMKYKKNLFDSNTSVSINLNIIAYKSFKLYYDKLDDKYKKKLNNLCVNLRYPYIIECVNNIHKYNPNVNIKNCNIDLDLYLIIKQEILAN